MVFHKDRSDRFSSASIVLSGARGGSLQFPFFPLDFICLHGCLVDGIFSDTPSTIQGVTLVERRSFSLLQRLRASELMESPVTWPCSREPVFEQKKEKKIKSFEDDAVEQ